MFRRDRFREDLVEERCRDLLALDDRLAAVDVMLGLARPPLEPARCTCGAVLTRSARFCAACGRPAGEPTGDAGDGPDPAADLAEQS
jgi:hypothetical protein